MRDSDRLFRDEALPADDLDAAGEAMRRASAQAELSRFLLDAASSGADGASDTVIDAILGISDAPHYTACPSPFLGSFLREARTSTTDSDSYQRSPFAADVSEGKNDAIYGLHPYHTKVPPRAIARYILHYTEPGDVVLDGFCGSGMTGVAAQLCGDAAALSQMGFTVNGDGELTENQSTSSARLGVRRAILNDLAPAATFIAANYTAGRVRIDDCALGRFLDELEAIQTDEWMVPAADGSKQLVAYVVWSDVFFCPECAQEIVFWDACVDKTTGKVSAEVVCPHCRAAHTKRQLSRPFFQVHDQATGRVVEFARLQPVAVGVAGPDARNVIEREEPELLNYVLSGQDLTGSLGRFPDTPLDAGWEMYRHGMGKHRIQTHRQLYLPRTSVTLERIWALVSGIEDVDLRQMLRWVFTSVLFRCSRFNRRLPTGGGSPITGVLFIPSMIRQENPIRLFTRRLAEVLDFRTRSAPGSRKDVVVQTGDLGHLDLPENSVDYAFVDPPFGSNIFYADMNFLWESWLGVSTDREREAIVSDRALGDRKSVFDYTRLMTDAFSAVRRALKPGHWMTVEFHNSSNAVWNSISEALQGAGFVVADVRVLNKKQGSFRQVTAAGAVKSDLIISAYKPRTETEEEFGLTAGSPEAAWAFIRGHLRQLPVAVERGGELEVVSERQAFMLYDRMVAFHVRRGIRVPLSSPEFYAGLDERFPCRDGMYFLPEQANEYERVRLRAKAVQQLELFVTDEESAIQWLRTTLGEKPMTLQELHPLFMREISGWQEHERFLDLSELLDQSFVCYDGSGEVPSQIHAYLSSNFKELRGLDKDDVKLQAKAKDRWYVPNPRSAGDLAQLRERALLREFDGYAGTGDRLTMVRIEAVRAGFRRAWQERDYATIISIAERLPSDVLQEDEKLLMWYEQALTRSGS